MIPNRTLNPMELPIWPGQQRWQTADAYQRKHHSWRLAGRLRLGRVRLWLAVVQLLG